MSRAIELASMSIEEAGLREAARGGDVALLAWADRLEEQGREQEAEALRGLPALRDVLRDATRRYFRYLRGRRCREDFELRLFAAGPHGGWGCGPAWADFRDGFFEQLAASPGWPRLRALAGTDPVVNPLLEHWAELYPAAEWLARGLARIAHLTPREIC